MAAPVEPDLMSRCAQGRLLDSVAALIAALTIVGQGLCPVVAEELSANERRPNIVVILADDK